MPCWVTMPISLPHFPQLPFPYLNLLFIVPSCKAEVALLEIEMLWQLLCPPALLSHWSSGHGGGIRVKCCSHSCKPALLGESWGMEQGASIRPNSYSSVPMSCALNAPWAAPSPPVDRWTAGIISCCDSALKYQKLQPVRVIHISFPHAGMGENRGCPLELELTDGSWNS